MVWALAATTGAAALGSWLSSRSQKNAMENAYAKAAGMLSDSAIDNAFDRAQSRYAPTIGAMSADLATQNQAVGTSIQAQMNTTGLGSTGLGMAIAGGARHGASFRNRQLVADMDMAAMREALDLQTQKANLAFGGLSQAAQINPIASALQGASAGAGAFQNYQMGQKMLDYQDAVTASVRRGPPLGGFNPVTPGDFPQFGV